MATVLLADTDPRTAELLPRILSDHLPHLVVDVYTSVEDLTRHRTLGIYDTIAISPILLQGYHLLKYKADRHLFVPLLLTASLEDRALAAMYMRKEAFDLILKPLIAHEVVQSVKLALWQSALLKLLASKERTTARFRDHLAAFPYAVKAIAQLENDFERTARAITTSLQLLLTVEEEHALFDIAAFVEGFTKKRALDRILLLGQNATTH